MVPPIFASRQGRAWGCRLALGVCLIWARPSGAAEQAQAAPAAAEPEASYEPTPAPLFDAPARELVSDPLAKVTAAGSAAASSLAEELAQRARKRLAAGASREAAELAALAWVIEPRSERLLFSAHALASSNASEEAQAFFAITARTTGSLKERIEAEIAVRAAGPPLAPGSLQALAVRKREAAQAHFAAGRYRDALGSLILACVLEPLPPQLFNLAQALRRDGQLDAAELLYQRLLAEAPGTPLARETAGYLVDLSQRRRQRGRTRNLIIGAAVGAAVAFGIGLGIGLGVAPRGAREELTDLGFATVHF